MVDQLKKVLLAGLGSATYTYEKASAIIEQMVQKGKLTIEEGKELSQELKQNLHVQSDKFKPLTKQDMTELLKDMNLVTKDELIDIKNRLSVLEQKLH